MSGELRAAMACALLFSGEPTDRALMGWMPFSHGFASHYMTRPLGLFEYLNYAGAG